MASNITEEQLAEWEEDVTYWSAAMPPVSDVPVVEIVTALVAEVRRLRAERDVGLKYIGSCDHGECQNQARYDDGHCGIHAAADAVRWSDG